MKQNFLYIVLILLFSVGIIVSLLHPAYTNILGVFIILLSFAIGICSIPQKHKHAQNARIKTTKDILIFLVTFLLILFIGGVARMLANFYVSQQFGAVMGFVCAMLVSFAVGYFMRKGVMKLTA